MFIDSLKPENKLILFYKLKKLNRLVWKFKIKHFKRQTKNKKINSQFKKSLKNINIQE